MTRPSSKDAINRRLYKGLILVETAIYCISCLNRTVLGWVEERNPTLSKLCWVSLRTPTGILLQPKLR
ncbi:hypothetical protein [Nostoc sp.]|uniref:hypothetical protein n=1 Tax=Nostoc sp. TaxID=1180 RepID=UPI002D76CF1D|nr:hypothetical protein [Nostoc sp.]